MRNVYGGGPKLNNLSISLEIPSEIKLTMETFVSGFLLWVTHTSCSFSTPCFGLYCDIYARNDIGSLSHNNSYIEDPEGKFQVSVQE